jgi:hypothetical protein
MVIRFLREWRRWRPGGIADLPDGVANHLIRHHYAEFAEGVTPSVERAVAAVPRGDCEPKPRRFKK